MTLSSSELSRKRWRKVRARRSIHAAMARTPREPLHMRLEAKKAKAKPMRRLFARKAKA